MLNGACGPIPASSGWRLPRLDPLIQRGLGAPIERHARQQRRQISQKIVPRRRCRRTSALPRCRSPSRQDPPRRRSPAAAPAPCRHARKPGTRRCTRRSCSRRSRLHCQLAGRSAAAWPQSYPSADRAPRRKPGLRPSAVRCGAGAQRHAHAAAPRSLETQSLSIVEGFRRSGARARDGGQIVFGHVSSSTRRRGASSWFSSFVSPHETSIAK